MGNENTTAVKIEIRYSPASRSVSSDIARDIASNHPHGNIAIICAGNPTFAHAAFRKQWLQVLRALEREQASTFNTARLNELADKIAHMKALQFTTTPQADAVVFTTAKSFIAQPNPYDILYLTYPITDHMLTKISGNLPDSGIIIRYLRPELKSEYAAIRHHPWRQPM